MNNKRLYLAFGVAAIGAVLGVVAIQKARTTRTAVDTTPAQLSASSIQRAGDKAAARQSVDGVIDVAPALAERIVGLSSLQRVRFEDAVSGWFDTYLQEDFRDVAEGMLMLGIQPEPAWMEAPSELQSLWARRYATLAVAQYDTESVRLVKISPGEVMQLKMPIDQKQFESRRDSGRPFLDGIPDREREVMELVMPGQFIDENGESFEADYAIEFTWNPDTEQWVPTAYRGYGFPTGAVFEGAIP